VCPLTPRAAAVAVKSTIASRNNPMLKSKSFFCSGVKVGSNGSRGTLDEANVRPT
jgi:hypothetical protein